VAAEVQQVYFQMGAAVSFHRRPAAYVGYPQLARAVQLDADPEHTVERCAEALELDVGSGRAQFTAKLLAVQYATCDAERASQQALGHIEIGFGQHLAHPGAADALAVVGNGIGGLHGEAVDLTALLQQIEVTGAVTAEAEVVTDLQMLHTETVDQHLLDELVRRQLAQTAVEGQAQYPVNALLFQQRQLVAQTGQAWRRALGRKELPRLGLEDHHANGHPEALAMGLQALENRPVTGMHAVEVPDCRHASPMTGAQIVQAADQFHKARYWQRSQSGQVYRVTGGGVMGRCGGSPDLGAMGSGALGGPIKPTAANAASACPSPPAQPQTRRYRPAPARPSPIPSAANPN